jgi:uncharacterized protein (TIGR00290 family)
MKPRLWLSWSSGKDSAWALHALRAQGDYEIAGLLTTINETASRVAMHAVRETLLEKQAAAAGVPLIKVRIPHPCPNDAYEAAMADAMARAQKENVTAVAFGDLFLEDVRRYRVEKLAPTGIEPVFPIWGIPTDRLARDMVASGLRAHVTCVDPKQLDARFAGRVYDNAFLDDLPDGADPCGENGEFHSFAFAGPMFDAPIKVTPGETVERDGFVFSDLMAG